MTTGCVIMSYGYGHLAAHCLDSVLHQKTQFDRVWFIDDGKGDCEHLVPIYAKSPRLTIKLRPERLGIARGFGDALDRVTTDRVVFIGADNWFRRDANYCFKRFGPGCDILTYDIMVVGEGVLAHKRLFPDECHEVYEGVYWKRSPHHHGSVLYNTEMAREAGGFPDKITPGREEDRVLWQRMVDKGATVGNYPGPLLYYRRHAENHRKCT